MHVGLKQLENLICFTNAQVYDIDVSFDCFRSFRFSAPFAIMAVNNISKKRKVRCLIF